MRSVELFAGAGGLAIGMANAGFNHAAVIEWDHDACETFRENQRHHMRSVEQWPLIERDVRRFDYTTIGEEVMVVSGGPPCQPFSLGGKHRGYMDERDMFPEAVRAVRELRPKAFIFENVKGLLAGDLRGLFRVRPSATHPSGFHPAQGGELARASRPAGEAPHFTADSLGIQRCLPTAQRRQLRRTATTRARVPRRVPLRSWRALELSRGDKFGGRAAALAMDHRRVLGSAQDREAPASHPVGSPGDPRRESSRHTDRRQTAMAHRARRARATCQIPRSIRTMASPIMSSIPAPAAIQGTQAARLTSQPRRLRPAITACRAAKTCLRTWTDLCGISRHGRPRACKPSPTTTPSGGHGPRRCASSATRCRFASRRRWRALWLVPCYRSEGMSKHGRSL